VTALSEYLLEWCNTHVSSDTYRQKRMGQILSAFKWMGVECAEVFTHAHMALREQNAAKQDYSVQTEAELETLKCSDGKYLTTQKLQDFYMNNMPGDIGPYHRMQFSFVAFHGQRSEDWQVPYGEEHKDTDDNYYDPSSGMMHVSGKTDRKKKGTKRNVRHFKVHPEVQKAIARYHEGKDSVWLVPQLKDPAKCCNTLRKNIQRYFFAGPEKSPWGGDTPNPYGLPLKVNLSLFRDLYETHIRYVAQWSQKDIQAEMNNIGHSNDMAIKRYSEKLRLTAVGQSK